MTTVNFKPGMVECIGHAGWDIQGKDIVCSGISTLMFAFAEALNRTQEAAEYYEDLVHGIIRITFQETEEARIMLKVIKAGMELISIDFPQNIMIEEENENGIAG